MENETNEERIWIHPHPTHLWWPGQVVGKEGSILMVEDDKGEVHCLEDLNVKRVHLDSIGTNNVTKMADQISLNSTISMRLLFCTMLDIFMQIRVRYSNNQIYTAVGSGILVGVNPYQTIGIYGNENMSVYRGLSVYELSECVPHVYRTAETAYRYMMDNGKNQSIIITGESGAGKTESTKHILKYLSHHSEDSGRGDKISDKVVYTNSILEAYGNAKTMRNDNSSRFGKFIKVNYDEKGQVWSADISSYLLEKSRVVGQTPGERNYHIFYMLLDCAPREVREKYGIDADGEFKCVSRCEDRRSEFKEGDEERWREVEECLAGMGMLEEEKEGLLRCVALVMHLSNFEFEEDGEGGVRVQEGREKQAAKLLGVDGSALDRILCKSWIMDPLKRERLETGQDERQAEQNLHTLMKDIYSRLFEWLVKRINAEINKRDTHHPKDVRCVGLLDIFGFEIFETNSFEQLCINYTNERLQQHFNNHLFKVEQKEYSDQRIKWTHLDHTDNLEVISLISQPKTLCILTLLDEQSKLQNGNDQMLASQLQQHLGSNPKYLPSPKTKRGQFGISHFAGAVYYTIDGFVEKNRNTKNKFIEVLQDSSVPIIRTLFKDSGKQVSSKQVKSVSSSFVEQLDALLCSLTESGAFYVRCIKPNNFAKPNLLDARLVNGQLKYAGMLEAIRIRKSGFPIRRPFSLFSSMYRLLFRNLRIETTVNTRDAIMKLVVSLERSKLIPGAGKSIQVGMDKVFMREDAEMELDRLNNGYLSHFATKLQRFFSGRLKRIRLRRVTSAVFRVVRLMRCERRAWFVVCMLKQARREDKALHIIQNFWRSAVARKKCRAAIQEKRRMRALNKEEETDNEKVRNEDTLNPVKHMQDKIEYWMNCSQDKMLEGYGKVEEHPKYLELQMENSDISRKLRELRSAYEAEVHNPGPKKEMESLRKLYAEMKVKLNEKESLIKEYKKEKSRMRDILASKNSEIDRYKRDLQSQITVDQDQFLTEVSRIDDFIKQKDSAIRILESENAYLKQCIEKRIIVSENEEYSRQFMGDLKDKLMGFRGGQDTDRSVNFEESKISHLVDQTLQYKRIASLSTEIMYSLIKLNEHKTLEISLLTREYIKGESSEILGALKNNLSVFKQQEAGIRAQIKEGLNRIKEIEEALPDEDEEEDEEEDPEIGSSETSVMVETLG